MSTWAQVALFFGCPFVGFVIGAKIDERRGSV
jgi:hypothetical protein